MRNFLNIFPVLFLLFFGSFVLISCGGFDPADARKTPVKGTERAKKNLDEGRGISLKNLGKGLGTTTYEFSTSNAMWRATFDVIDFMPLVTVDYAGGLIITDWYTDNKAPNESLKFTIRFLSNELRADSLKIIVHRKICTRSTECVTKKISSKLEDEIRTAILQKAAILNVEKKEGKKKKDKEKKGFLGFGKAKNN